jgi:hypothetical protein
MAFGSSSVLDTFNRANGSLGANWATIDGGTNRLAITSNAVYVTGGHGGSSNVYTAATYDVPCEAFVTVAVVDTADYTGYEVWICAGDTGGAGFDGYYASWWEGDASGGWFGILRVDNGVETVLDEATSVLLSSGDKLGIEVAADGTISGYRYASGAWSALLTDNDTTYTTGRAGIGMYAYAGVWDGRLDDFAAGEVAGGPTTYPVTLAGALTPAAVLAKQSQRLLAGSITPAAALLRQPHLLLAGGITPAGALGIIKVLLVALAGSITPAGVLAKRAGLTLVGALVPAATLARQVGVLRGGALAPAGSLVKQAALGLAGGLTPSALIEALRLGLTLTVDLAGALAPSGALLRQARIGLAGAVTPAGALVRQAGLSLAGALTPAGAAAKQARLQLAGSLVPAGAVVAVNAGLIAARLILGAARARVLDGIARARALAGAARATPGRY